MKEISGVLIGYATRYRYLNYQKVWKALCLIFTRKKRLQKSQIKTSKFRKEFCEIWRHEISLSNQIPL